MWKTLEGGLHLATILTGLIRKDFSARINRVQATMLFAKGLHPGCQSDTTCRSSNDHQGLAPTVSQSPSTQLEMSHFTAEVTSFVHWYKNETKKSQTKNSAEPREDVQAMFPVISAR